MPIRNLKNIQYNLPKEKAMQKGKMKDPEKLLARLETDKRLFDSVFQITTVINNRKLDYSRRMEAILKIILEYLCVEHGSIMVLEGKKELVVRAATRSELIGLRKPLDEDCVSCWVAKTASPEFIKDISKDLRFKEQPSSVYRTKSLLSVPIIQGKKVVGVISVTDKTGNTDLLKKDISYLLDFSGFVLSLLHQQKLYDEVKRQRTTLRKRNRELRRQEAMQAELSRMLIHDLKGPLSEVVANLDILSFSISNENREFLEAAQLACDRTVRMASNLGTVARIEDGKMKLIKEEVDPKNLLEESIISIKGLAKIKDVELVIENSEYLPTVMVDRVLMLRVLQNLLTNALGYTYPGTAIFVGCKRVSGRKQLEFHVRDQGTGMPPDKKEFIFEKYARLSGKHDDLIGSGLGLYFCKLAVEEHRGKMGLESAEGKGSRFFFILPY